jgi:hypothetical protein
MASETPVASAEGLRNWLLVSSPYEINEFRDWLHHHLNYENLTFFLEVEAYRTLKDEEQRQKAYEMRLKYFTEGDYELNVAKEFKVFSFI